MVIDVISLGTALQVPPLAVNALRNADLIIGAERHLAAVDCGVAETAEYPSPLSGLASLLSAAASKKVVVLASGDALFFGIGSWLMRNVGESALRFHPNVSTVQAACARIGRAWQNIEFVSLRGRPLARLRAVLAAGKSLAIFTDNSNTPKAIAKALIDTGYADSRVHVFESLDSSEEQVRQFTATELADNACVFHPLNLLLVDVRGAGGLLPAFPGIADDVFAKGGDNMFTKREVRLAALSRLTLNAGEVAWDIGAGSGGIAIEWARWCPHASVYAIERDEQRCANFEINRARFGDHGNLELITGEAPTALTDLPDPDAIYVGGSGGALLELLDLCWQRLKTRGRLVVAGVTVETRAAMQNRSWPAPVDFIDIAISRAAPLGSQTTMRAQLPVLLATLSKP